MHVLGFVLMLSRIEVWSRRKRSWKRLGIKSCIVNGVTARFRNWRLLKA